MLCPHNWAFVSFHLLLLETLHAYLLPCGLREGTGGLDQVTDLRDAGIYWVPPPKGTFKDKPQEKKVISMANVSHGAMSHVLGQGSRHLHPQVDKLPSCPCL